MDWALELSNFKINLIHSEKEQEPHTLSEIKKEER